MIINPKKIVGEGIISGILNLEEQIQPNGIDLTLKSISRLDESDTNTLLLDQRYHCARESIDLDDEVENDDQLPYLVLEPGIYDVEFNERVNIPNGMMATIYGRSTVNRGGNVITAGLYDAGFNNNVGAILHVNIALAIEKNVRLAQIVFSEAEEGSMYDGIYNNQAVA